MLKMLHFWHDDILDVRTHEAGICFLFMNTPPQATIHHWNRETHWRLEKRKLYPTKDRRSHSWHFRVADVIGTPNMQTCAHTHCKHKCMCMRKWSLLKSISLLLFPKISFTITKWHEPARLILPICIEVECDCIEVECDLQIFQYTEWNICIHLVTGIKRSLRKKNIYTSTRHCIVLYCHTSITRKYAYNDRSHKCCTPDNFWQHELYLFWNACMESCNFCAQFISRDDTSCDT